MMEIACGQNELVQERAKYVTARTSLRNDALSEAEVRPWIDRCRRSHRAAATHRRRGRGDAIDDGAENVVRRDAVIGGIPARAVTNDQIAGRVGINSAVVKRDR